MHRGGRSGEGVSRREALPRLTLAGLALLSAPLLVACQDQAAARPTMLQGLVVEMQAASFVRVGSFTLRTGDGSLVELTPEGDIGINAAHLREHMVLADPVIVTVRYEGDRVIALRVDDVPEATPPAPAVTPVVTP